MARMSLMLAITSSVLGKAPSLRCPVMCVGLACLSHVLMCVMCAHCIVFWTLPQPSIMLP